MALIAAPGLLLLAACHLCPDARNLLPVLGLHLTRALRLHPGWPLLKPQEQAGAQMAAAWRLTACSKKDWTRGLAAVSSMATAAGRGGLAASTTAGGAAAGSAAATRMTTASTGGGAAALSGAAVAAKATGASLAVRTDGGRSMASTVLVVGSGTLTAAASCGTARPASALLGLLSLEVDASGSFTGSLPARVCCVTCLEAP